MKNGLEVKLGNRYVAVKHFNKSDKKWKRDLKYLNKHNKILYSIAKRTGSHRELKNTNNIRAKSSKNYEYFSSNISSSDSESSLSSVIE